MSDTSTRSGMLWEVERILSECYELGTLPQCLVMENVPQVHQSGDNAKNFLKWQSRLEELGYKSYVQDLIATDYGIPQTRNRCFMVSILGDYSYQFPKPIPLKLKLKDILENNVDEKYYLSGKQIQDVGNWNAYQKPLENMEQIDKTNISPTLTTRSGAYAAGMVLVKEEQTLKRELCDKLIKDGLVEEYDIVKHSYTSQILDGNKKCVEKNDGNMITLTTRGDCVGVTVKTIGNYSPSNHNASRIVDKEYVAPTVMENHGTITATQLSDLRIRKLTPRECGRLMGVKDEDIDKILKRQSDASAYHLFGDSIVVDVIKAIIGELLWNIM